MALLCRYVPSEERLQLNAIIAEAKNNKSSQGPRLVNTRDIVARERAEQVERDRLAREEADRLAELERVRVEEIARRRQEKRLQKEKEDSIFSRLKGLNA